MSSCADGASFAFDGADDDATDSASIALAGSSAQAKIDLGRKLFFDERLSVPNGISCGTCHDPFHGWGDGRPQGKGIQDNTLNTTGHDGAVAIAGNQFKTFLTTRNTPTIYNSHIFANLFWDGRAGDQTHQAQFPFEESIEMNSSWNEHILPLLRNDDAYIAMFNAAFEDNRITKSRATSAMGAFEETISTFTTPYDRYTSGNPGAMTPQQVAGHDLFFGAAGCAQCHPAPFLTDFGVHNTGVPSAGQMALKDQVDLGFGVRTDLTVTPPVVHDDPADYAKFKTAQLRMVGVTGPYMHNGAFRTLEEVVEFYNAGGGPDLSGTGTKSPVIVPLGLTQQEKADLVAFLRGGLTDTEIK